MAQIPQTLQNALASWGIVINPATGVLTVAQWQTFSGYIAQTSNAASLKQMYTDAVNSQIMPAGVNS
jgi:hypothetical protein